MRVRYLIGSTVVTTEDLTEAEALEGQRALQQVGIGAVVLESATDFVMMDGDTLVIRDRSGRHRGACWHCPQRGETGDFDAAYRWAREHRSAHEKEDGR